MSLDKATILSMVSQGLITTEAATALASAIRAEAVDNNYDINIEDLTVVRVTENGRGFKEVRSELKALVDTKIAEARKTWEDLRKHQAELTRFRKADLG